MRMRNHLKKYQGGVAALIVGSLAACAPANTGTVEPAEPTATTGATEQAEPTANPYACQTGADPRSDDVFNWFSPDCSCITSVTHGPSWEGLTIGESTLEDVQSVLDAEGVQSPQDNAWQFYDLHEPGIWYKAEACFVEDKLSILYIGLDSDTRKMDLEQFLEEYGPPDRVTWGPSFATRSLILSDRGLLFSVTVAGDMGGTIVLFPPIPPEALETSWLMASLPDGPVGCPTDPLAPRHPLTNRTASI